jgi:flagellin
LSVAFENTSAAESSIRDTDFATETAELTRSQILVNAATNVLSIANQQPQSVLALLG